MKIILMKDVKDLGKVGDLVDAKPGYARNFLLPKGAAIEATPGNLERWEKEQAKRAEKEETEHKEALELKEELEKVTVSLEGKAGESGKLFGSITSKDIAKGLNEQHKIKIDRRKIQLEDNIKTLGIMEIEVKVYSEITAKLKVEVKVK